MSLAGETSAETLERLAGEHGLFFCVECGKCSAVCPMGTLFDDFDYDASPRGVVERVLLGQEVHAHPKLWYCLTCDVCTAYCPQGVSFRDFMEAARIHLVAAGETEHGSFCRACGGYLWPMHTTEHLKARLGAEAEALLETCPRCRRREYADTMHRLAPPKRRR